VKKFISKKTGFTLVEVLAAVTIGGFIMLVAVGTLKAITSSAKMIDININASSEVRFAMNLIKRDLVNFYRDENMENTKLIGISGDTGDGGTRIIFYTVNRMKARTDFPEGDIYEVEYVLMEGDQDEGSNLLVRRLWPNPNEEYEPGGIEVVIAEDVEAFEVRYNNGEEWSDEWPEEMDTLPHLIEVSIVGQEQSRGTAAIESTWINLVRNVTSSLEASGSSEESGQGGGGQGGNQGGGGQDVNQGGGGGRG